MKILIPLPQRDFDPTEVAVSWQILAGAGHDVIFATPEGKLAPADPVMLDGIGLDYWSRIPGLKHLTLSALRYVPIAALAPLILHLCTMRHFLRKSSGLFRDSP